MHFGHTVKKPRAQYVYIMQGMNDWYTCRDRRAPTTLVINGIKRTDEFRTVFRLRGKKDPLIPSFGVLRWKTLADFKKENPEYVMEPPAQMRTRQHMRRVGLGQGNSFLDFLESLSPM